jgi:hypothetical protein
MYSPFVSLCSSHQCVQPCAAVMNVVDRKLLQYLWSFTHTEKTLIVVNVVERKLLQYLWLCTHRPTEETCIVVNVVDSKSLQYLWSCTDALILRRLVLW